RRAHPLDRLTDHLFGEVFASYRGELPKSRQAEALMRWGTVAEFWRAIPIREVGPQTFRDFFAWRRRTTKGITPHTLHKDCVRVRQVLKYALEQEIIDRLPVIPGPGRIAQNPRPWLTPAEWRHLLATAQERIADAPNVRTLYQRADLVDMM